MRLTEEQYADLMRRRSAPVAAPAKKVECVCQTCQNRFFVKPSDVARGSGKYCSPSCYATSRKASVVSRSCRKCGALVMSAPDNVQRYCASCNPPAVAVEPRSCMQCGKTIAGASRAEVRNSKFCGMACYSAYMTAHKAEVVPAPNGSCVKCGKPKYISPAQRAKGQGKHCIGCKPLSLHSTGKGGTREDLGIYVRSSWEANYARYLNWLVQQKAIREWKYEPRTFTFDRIKRGSRFYTPDFLVVANDGSEEYHEVKGWMDARSKTKLNRMARYYPHIKVIVIANAEMREIKRKVGALLPHWEDGKSDKLGRKLRQVKARYRVDVQIVRSVQ